MTMKELDRKKRPCAEVDSGVRMQRMADMLWEGTDAPKPVAGTCRFCGSELSIIYNVMKGGNFVQVRRDDEEALMRIDRVLAADKEDSGMSVFPLSSCECMTVEDIYLGAQEEVLLRRDRCRASQSGQSKKKEPEKLEEGSVKSF